MRRRHAPHPAFAFAWVVVWLNVWVGIARVFLTDGWQWGLGSLAGFFVFEALALRVNWRWTLSAVVTWCVKSLSKHDRPFVGWNNLVWLVAFPFGLLIFLLCDVLVPGPRVYGIVAGLAMGGPLVAGLHAHWLAPEIHG